jgi:hypothetical protein
MATLPPAQPSERPINSIDRFAALTVQASEEAARHARGMVSTLGLLCLVLFFSLIAAAWRVNAMEVERAALIADLRSEQAARVDATLAASDVEMKAATYDLDTRVRRDIVDEQLLQQARRSAELERLAAQVERDKLVEANCVTPRSIFASGL